MCGPHWRSRFHIGTSVILGILEDQPIKSLLCGNMIARFVLSRRMDLGLKLGHQVKRIESHIYVYICNYMYGR
jgi:hypothetical protein